MPELKPLTVAEIKAYAGVITSHVMQQEDARVAATTLYDECWAYAKAQGRALSDEDCGAIAVSIVPFTERKKFETGKAGETAFQAAQVKSKDLRGMYKLYYASFKHSKVIRAAVNKFSDDVVAATSAKPKNAALHNARKMFARAAVTGRGTGDNKVFGGKAVTIALASSIKSGADARDKAGEFDGLGADDWAETLMIRIRQHKYSAKFHGVAAVLAALKEVSKKSSDEDDEEKVKAEAKAAEAPENEVVDDAILAATGGGVTTPVQPQLMLTAEQFKVWMEGQTPAR